MKGGNEYDDLRSPDAQNETIESVLTATSSPLKKGTKRLNKRA